MDSVSDLNKIKMIGIEHYLKNKLDKILTYKPFFLVEALIYEYFKHSVHLSNIDVSNNDNIIVVKKSEIGPKKGEMATTVMTAPYCIALIPKGNKLIIE